MSFVMSFTDIINHSNERLFNKLRDPVERKSALDELANVVKLFRRENSPTPEEPVGYADGIPVFLSDFCRYSGVDGRLLVAVRLLDHMHEERVVQPDAVVTAWRPQMGFTFINRGHLGGFIQHDGEHPNGDPATYTPVVWDYLVEHYAPKTVLDIGCGEGHAVKYLRSKGVAAYGVEGCQDAWRSMVCDPAHVIVHDFTQSAAAYPEGFPKSFDMAWCCEFVEHVEERYKDRFLGVFERCGVVAMTHAFPGQPGHHHVNCQLPDYWIKLMESIGFRLDKEVTGATRALAPSSHWLRSGLVFVKEKT
jgi:hypothetical protein